MAVFVDEKINTPAPAWPVRAQHHIGRMINALGRVMKYGAYTRRTYLVRPEQKLLYLSISKAACSSIKASILSLDRQENYQRLHGAVAREGDQLYDAPLKDYPDYFKFTFVRNPFDRLVSCYENKYHTDRALLGKELKHLYFDYYLMGYLRKDRGFAEFARRVRRIPDKWADKHLISQFSRVRDKDGKQYLDFIGRFENLAVDYEPIRAKYNLAPLTVYNKTGKGNWMDYYDEKTARLVYERYRQDIEAFGYEDSYQALLAHIRQKEGAR